MQVTAGVKRTLACATINKEHITPAILSNLVATIGQQNASLSDVRTLCLYLLGYAGFFRFVISWTSVSIKTMLRSSWSLARLTMQLRDGAWVVIARTGSVLCPVEMLKRYMHMAGRTIENRQDRLLFRAIVNTKEGQRLRNSG